MNTYRRSFMKSGLLLITGWSGLSAGFSRGPGLFDHGTKDPLKPELVKEFVYNAHANIEKVKEMLSAEPALLNCSWDWGGGDFETALNAAGHMGRSDIAALLLDAGARMDLFCAAMLGKIEIVRSILSAFPDLKTSKGPHGLMLIHHARQGKENSTAVLDYLQSIGAT